MWCWPWQPACPCRVHSRIALSASRTQSRGGLPSPLPWAIRSLSSPFSGFHFTRLGKLCQMQYFLQVYFPLIKISFRHTKPCFFTAKLLELGLGKCWDEEGWIDKIGNNTLFLSFREEKEYSARHETVNRVVFLTVSEHKNMSLCPMKLFAPSSTWDKTYPS